MDSQAGRRAVATGGDEAVACEGAQDMKARTFSDAGHCLADAEVLLCAHQSSFLETRMRRTPLALALSLFLSTAAFAAGGPLNFSYGNASKLTGNHNMFLTRQPWRGQTMTKQPRLPDSDRADDARQQSEDHRKQVRQQIQQMLDKMQGMNCRTCFQ
jgi:hypothetical protein